MNKSDFDIHFDLAFKSKKKTDFEKWFGELAACVLGKDFEPIKAGGKSGDKKSDGRCVSTETIFQCYAPESSSTFSKLAKNKISDSFPDVTKFWPNLKEWIFVHNSEEGLPSSASDEVEKLRSQYPNITIVTPSPRRYLKDNFHDKLSLQQLIDVYPSSALNYSEVSMEDIRPLLRRIIDEKPRHSANPDFGEIPDEAKLDYNEFSDEAKYDIGRAMPYVDIVNRYLQGISNPNRVSEIQSRLQEKYKELKSLGHHPDEILAHLLTYVGSDGTPTVRAASYIIVSYYFDSCDIFENTPEIKIC